MRTAPGGAALPSVATAARSVFTRSHSARTSGGIVTGTYRVAGTGTAFHSCQRPLPSASISMENVTGTLEVCAR